MDTGREKIGKAVGHCGLLQKKVEGKEEIELIYVMDRSFQGFGYATEISRMLLAFAFKIKKIDSVIALIEPENRASEKVAVKAGMTLEKTVIRDENRQMHLYRISHA